MAHLSLVSTRFETFCVLRKLLKNAVLRTFYTINQTIHYALGARCRRFESCRPDALEVQKRRYCVVFEPFCFCKKFVILVWLTYGSLTSLFMNYALLSIVSINSHRFHISNEYL